jgi:hypothetical protein
MKGSEKAMPAILALHHLWLLTIAILQDNAFSDFGDLGNQLLIGFVLAVVVAVAYTFIKMRWREQRPPEQFISINSLKDPDEATTKVSHE